MKNRKDLIYWLLVVAWMGVIFYFSSKPANESDKQSLLIINSINQILNELSIKVQLIFEQWNFSIRKLAHLTEYAILGILLYNAFRVSRVEKNLIPYSLLICMIYAITDEIHQLFVPGRTGKIVDVGVDSLGGVLGLIFMILLMSVQRILKGNKR